MSRTWDKWYTWGHIPHDWLCAVYSWSRSNGSAYQVSKIQYQRMIMVHLIHSETTHSNLLVYTTRSYFYRPQRSWGKVMFSQACVILFTGDVHGCWGGCVVAREACMIAVGMRGCGGACMFARGCMDARGHAWLLGGCMVAGACVVAGGGHAWLPGVHAWWRGACMAKGGVHGEGGCVWHRGACMGYDEIRKYD